MILPAILLGALTGVAAAPVPEVSLELPRDHGWWIGDVLVAVAVVRVDPAMELDPASLPAARALTYWLDLRTVGVTDQGVADGRRTYVIDFEYQTFYAPLEPKKVTVPAVSLGFRNGDGLVEATIPPWSFVTSPLREIMAPTVVEALREPPLPAITDTTRRQAEAGGLVGLGLLSTLALLWHRNLWPFRRVDRPFGRAARAVRRALATGSGDAAYREALLALHRGFDTAHGRRMLADDLAAFLKARPGLSGDADTISRFFDASRRAFFGADTSAAAHFFPAADLRRLAARLAEHERRRP